jgi:hypothetical protein
MPDLTVVYEAGVVPLCKGWREFKGKSSQHFDSNLIIVVMNEIPNGYTMIL